MTFLEKLPGQLPDGEKQLRELQEALKRIEDFYAAVRQMEPGERRDILQELVLKTQSILAKDLDNLGNLIGQIDAIQKVPREKIAELLEKYDL